MTASRFLKLADVAEDPQHLGLADLRAGALRRPDRDQDRRPRPLAGRGHRAGELHPAHVRRVAGSSPTTRSAATATRTTAGRLTPDTAPRTRAERRLY